MLVGGCRESAAFGLARAEGRFWTSASRRSVGVPVEPLRNGGGRVDARGAWLVGAKGEYPLHRPYLPSSPGHQVVSESSQGTPTDGHRVPRVGVRDSARRRRPSRTPPARPSTTPREAQDATDTRRADGTFPRSGTFTHAGRGPRVADFFSPCEGSSGDGTRFHVIFLPPPGGAPPRAWRRRDGNRLPAPYPFSGGSGGS